MTDRSWASTPVQAPQIESCGRTTQRQRPLLLTRAGRAVDVDEAEAVVRDEPAQGS